MTHSFKFSIRHLLIAVAAAAFIFWFVKNYYDSKNLAESHAQLRAAKIAGSAYLYDKLLSDESVIGKKPDEIPGLNELSIKPKQMNERERVEWAISWGDIVRSAPTTLSQEGPAQTAGAAEKSAPLQRNPTLTYVSGDCALYFCTTDKFLVTEGSERVGFWLYIRNGKILAILDYVHRVPS